MKDKLDPNYIPTQIGGQGVKRVNKLPLLILIFLGAIVTIAITYAALQRTQHQRDEKKEQKEIKDALITEQHINGAQELLNKHQTHGTVPPIVPASESIDTASMEQDAKDKRALLRQSEPLNSTPVAPQSSRPIDTQLEKRLLKLQERQLDMLVDAVVSNTSVPFENKGQQESSPKNSSHNKLMSLAEVEALHQQKTASMLQGYLKNQSVTGLALNDMLQVSTSSTDNHGQQEKTRFVETERRFGYSTETRQAALSPFELKVGTIIPAVLITEINSDLPGLIKALVSQNVRDTRSGKSILIPQGAIIIGRYDSQVAMGQTRVLVGWHRIQYPDGSTLELGNMGGTDMKGQSGFQDQINNHYWRIFGNATMLSLISAGIQLSQAQDDSLETLSRSEIIAGEMGRQYGELGAEMIRKNMNIQPTLEIRSGYKFTVMVNKDLILAPYTPYPAVNY